jgi:hypothetical protein
VALSDDLMSAWEMDEASGSALDSHGSEDLTEGGTVGTGTGIVYGTARDFEAGDSTDAFTCDPSGFDPGNTDWTFEVWFRKESNSGTILAGNGSAAFQLFDFGGTVYLNSGGVASQFNVGSVSSAAWHQVFVYHDATNNLFGMVLDGGSPATSSTGGSAPASWGTNLTVGNSGGLPFDGLIGPVRLWNRLLSGAEKTELYNAGAGRTYAYITAGGGGVTVALTGSAATISAGVLVPATTVTIAGSAATVSAGVLTLTSAVALTGSAPVCVGGTLAPSCVLGLSGSAAGASAGTVGPVLSAALSGSEATAAAGSVGSARALALSGLAVTVVAGSLEASGGTAQNQIRRFEVSGRGPTSFAVDGRGVGFSVVGRGPARFTVDGYGGVA